MRTHDAFISYAYKDDASRQLVVALKSGLERLLRRWYQLRSFDLFLDQDQLPLDSDLWKQIHDALGLSNRLLVLLSTESAKSRGVSRELQWWLKYREAGKIVLVLVSGELAWDDTRGAFDPDLSTALPAELASAFPAEPHWLDLRHIAKATSLVGTDAAFRRVLLQLAATLRAVPMDELESDALHARRANMRWAVGALCLVTLGLVSSIVLGWRTQNARILGEARLLQPSLPTESFLVLSELAHRWWSDDDILPALTAEVLSSRLSTLRHRLPAGAAGISVAHNGVHAAALQDGTSRLWNRDGRLLAEIPARAASTPDEKSKFALTGVPLGKLAFVDDGRALASLDWSNCLRLLPMKDAAYHLASASSTQQCLNESGTTYGAAAWNQLGHLAWSQGSSLSVKMGSMSRTIDWPKTDIIERITPFGDGQALVLLAGTGSVAANARTASRRTVQPGAIDIGSCADGSAWSVDAQGVLRREPTGSSIALAGGKPWILSPACGLYVDGEGSVYRSGESRPLLRQVAPGWDASGSMVRLAFADDDSALAVSSRAGEIALYDIRSKGKVKVLGHRQRIFDMRFSADGTELYSASYDRMVRRFDTRGGLIYAEAPPGAKSVYAGIAGPAFSAEPYIGPGLQDTSRDQSQSVAMLGHGASAPSTVKVDADWKLPGGHHVLFDTEIDMAVLICREAGCPPDSVVRSLPADGAEVPAHARASRDGRYIVAVDSSGQIRLFDLRRSDNDPVFRFTAASSSNALDAAFDATGSRLFILDGSKVIGVTLTLDEVGRAVSRRISDCLSAQERVSYLAEWAWVAALRARVQCN